MDVGGEPASRISCFGGGDDRGGYETDYLPSLEAVRQAELPEAYEHKTPGDIFLWVHGKRRELRMMNPQATWAEAATAARRKGVPRGEQQALKCERRSPLPSETPLM